MRLAIASLVLVSAATAQWPAREQNAPVLLFGGTVHTMEGRVIKNGQVLFEKGKITGVGRNLRAPAGTRRVNCARKHVFPGLIAATSVLGLVEINAVRATRDFAEVGGLTPEVRAEVSFHPDSKLIPVARAGGVLLAHVVPQGGRISGSSAVMMLDGWTWEEMTLAAPAGIHVRWPNMAVGAGEGREKRRKERDAAIREIQDAFRNARAYGKAKRAEAGGGPYHAVDRRMQALLPAASGQVPVFVHADELRQIRAACDWAKAEGLQLVIVGGRDAWRATELLKAGGVPVIVTAVHRLPSRRFADYDAPFTLPRKLHEAGVRFCISGGGRAGDASNERNLPFHAATAAAYGLPRGAALRAVTIDAARILGVEARVGSIRKGKDATLIVTTGSPLEVRTRIEQAFLEGREVDLDSHHEQLYRKYREKYRRLGSLRRR